MPPRSSALLPAATVDPRAPKKLVGGRWAHDRGLPGMVTISSLPMSLSPETGVPTLLERVARSVADLDGYTAARVERVPVASPQRRFGVRGRERYTRPPSPKGPYPVGGVRTCGTVDYARL